MWGYIGPLLRFSFWFSLEAIPFTAWAGTLIFGLSVGLILGGIGVRAWISRKKSMDKDMRLVYRRVSSCLVWAGVVLNVLYWLTWLEIPVLSVRFLFLVWLGGFAWWAYAITHHVLKIMPAERAKLAEKQAYEKWLPKPKK